MTDLQLFDALPAHIEDALRASIKRFGVLVPIAVDQDGRTIDGHHRARIAREEAADCPERMITVASDDEWPHIRGGASAIANLRTLCKACNVAKNDRVNRAA